MSKKMEPVQPVKIETEPEAETLETGANHAAEGLDGEIDQTPVDGVCDPDNFRIWYGGRFHLLSNVLGFMFGGPIEAMMVDAESVEFRRVADQLYQECLSNHHQSAIARWMLKPARGGLMTLETQGGFLIGVAEASYREIQGRIAAAQAAQHEQGTSGPSGGGGEGQSERKPGKLNL